MMKNNPFTVSFNMHQICFQRILEKFGFLSTIHSRIEVQKITPHTAFFHLGLRNWWRIVRVPISFPPIHLEFSSLKNTTVRFMRNMNFAQNSVQLAPIWYHNLFSADLNRKTSKKKEFFFLLLDQN